MRIKDQSVQINSKTKNESVGMMHNKTILNHNSPIHLLAQYAIDKYYKQPYPVTVVGDVPRPWHGGVHVCCAASFLLDITIDLIKKHLPDHYQKILINPVTNLPFTEQDIKLIRLALIYHDVANTSDETFHDEEKHAQRFEEDALQFGFPEKDVKVVANAMRIKDSKEPQHIENIYKILIHDPDCFEFIRCLMKPNPTKINLGLFLSEKRSFDEFKIALLKNYPDLAAFRYEELDIVKLFRKHLPEPLYKVAIIDVLRVVIHHRESLQFLYFKNDKTNNHKFFEFSDNCYLTIKNGIMSICLERTLPTIDRVNCYQLINVMGEELISRNLSVACLDWYLTDNIIQSILELKAEDISSPVEIKEEITGNDDDDEILLRFKQSGVYIRRLLRQNNLTRIVSEIAQLRKNEVIPKEKRTVVDYKNQNGYRHRPCTLVIKNIPMEDYSPVSAGYIVIKPKCHGFFKTNVWSNAIGVQDFISKDGRTVKGHAKDLKSHHHLREKMQEMELRRQGMLYDPYNRMFGKDWHHRNENLAEIVGQDIKGILISYNSDAIHDALAMAIYCKLVYNHTLQFYVHDQEWGLYRLSTRLILYLINHARHKDNKNLESLAENIEDHLNKRWCASNLFPDVTVPAERKLTEEPIYISCSLATDSPSVHHPIRYKAYYQNSYTEHYYLGGRLVVSGSDDKNSRYLDDGEFESIKNIYYRQNIYLINVLFHILNVNILDNFNLSNIQISLKEDGTKKEKMFLELIMEPIIWDEKSVSKLVSEQEPQYHNILSEGNKRAFLDYIGYDDRYKILPGQNIIQLAAVQKMEIIINKLLHILEKEIDRNMMVEVYLHQSGIKEKPPVLLMSIFTRARKNLLSKIFHILYQKRIKQLYQILPFLQSFDDFKNSIALLENLFCKHYEESCINSDKLSITELIHYGFLNVPSEIVPPLKLFSIISRLPTLKSIFNAKEFNSLLFKVLNKALYKDNKDFEKNMDTKDFDAIKTITENIVDLYSENENGHSVVSLLAQHASHPQILKLLISALENSSANTPLNQMAIGFGALLKVKYDFSQLKMIKPETLDWLNQKHKNLFEHKEEIKLVEAKTAQELKSTDSIMDSRIISAFKLVASKQKPTELSDILDAPVFFRIFQLLPSEDIFNLRMVSKTYNVKIRQLNILAVLIIFCSKGLITDESISRDKLMQILHSSKNHSLQLKWLAEYLQRPLKDYFENVDAKSADKILVHDELLYLFHHRVLFDLLETIGITSYEDVFDSESKQKGSKRVNKPLEISLQQKLVDYFVDNAAVHPNVNEFAQLAQLPFIKSGSLNQALLKITEILVNSTDKQDLIFDPNFVIKFFILILLGANVNEEAEMSITLEDNSSHNIPVPIIIAISFALKKYFDVPFFKLLVEHGADLDTMKTLDKPILTPQSHNSKDRKTNKNKQNGASQFGIKDLLNKLKETGNQRVVDELLYHIVKQQLNPNCQWHPNTVPILKPYKEDVFSHLMKIADLDPLDTGLKLLKNATDEKLNSVLYKLFITDSKDKKSSPKDYIQRINQKIKQCEQFKYKDKQEQLEAEAEFLAHDHLHDGEYNTYYSLTKETLVTQAVHNKLKRIISDFMDNPNKSFTNLPNGYMTQLFEELLSTPWKVIKPPANISYKEIKVPAAIIDKILFLLKEGFNNSSLPKNTVDFSKERNAQGPFSSLYIYCYGKRPKIFLKTLAQSINSEYLTGKDYLFRKKVKYPIDVLLQFQQSLLVIFNRKSQPKPTDIKELILSHFGPKSMELKGPVEEILNQLQEHNIDRYQQVRAVMQLIPQTRYFKLFQSDFRATVEDKYGVSKPKPPKLVDLLKPMQKTDEVKEQLISMDEGDQDKPKEAISLKEIQSQMIIPDEIIFSKFMYIDSVNRPQFSDEKWEKWISEIKNKAKTDPSAQFQLGLALVHGKKIRKDEKQGVKLLKKACDGGHTEARNAYATALFRGIGVTKDQSQAIKLLYATAKEKNVHSLLLLATFHQYLFDQSGDLSHEKQWISWTLKAAELDTSEVLFCQHNMGVVFENGLLGYKKNKMQAKKWYQKAAYGGFHLTLKKLGNYYLELEESPENTMSAIIWFTKAIKSDPDHVVSFKDLAQIFFQDKYRHLNRKLGLGLLMAGIKIAEKQNQLKTAGYFQFMISMVYFGSHGTESHNCKQNYKWMKKSYDNGYLRATSHLGLFYVVGEGVQPNIPEGLKLITTASENGYADKYNLYNLGMFYKEGKHLEKNRDKAKEWLQKAVSLGCKEAQKELEIMAKEEGVKKDLSSTS